MNVAMQNQTFPANYQTDALPDIHICGACKLQFTTVEGFLSHKRGGCPNVVQTSTPSVISVTSGQTVPSGPDNQFLNSIPVSVAVQPSQHNPVSTQQVPQSQQQQQAPQQERQSQTAAPVQHHDYIVPHILTISPDTLNEQNQTVNVPTTAATHPTPTAAPAPKPMTGSKSPKTKSTPEKRFKCDQPGCHFVSAYNKDLERHYRTHTGEKPFTCEMCNKAFNRRDKLKVHQRSHSGEKPYKCEYCNYGAADGSSLKKHIRIHTDERPFRCQICSYASRNSSQLVVHLRSHTGDCPFQCQQCDAKFKINSDLKRHMRIHTGEKPYKCEICDYRCAMRGNLKAHMRINHNPNSKLHCDECDFFCTSKRQLKLHAKMHQPDKPIKCLECNYSCASKAALKAHERIHSDERPFSCPYCKYDSKQPGNVRSHMKKKHGDKTREREAKRAKRNDKDKDMRLMKKTDNKRTDLIKLPSMLKKPLQCDMCDASFVRLDSLRSHKRQHTAIEKSLESTALAVLQLQQPVQNSDLHASQSEIVNASGIVNPNIPVEHAVEMAIAQAVSGEHEHNKGDEGTVTIVVETPTNTERTETVVLHTNTQQDQHGNTTVDLVEEESVVSTATVSSSYPAPITAVSGHQVTQLLHTASLDGLQQQNQPTATLVESQSDQSQHRVIPSNTILQQQQQTDQQQQHAGVPQVITIPTSMLLDQNTTQIQVTSLGTGQPVIIQQQGPIPIRLHATPISHLQSGSTQQPLQVRHNFNMPAGLQASVGQRMEPTANPAPPNLTVVAGQPTTSGLAPQTIVANPAWAVLNRSQGLALRPQTTHVPTRIHVAVTSPQTTLTRTTTTTTPSTTSQFNYM